MGTSLDAISLVRLGVEAARAESLASHVNALLTGPDPPSSAREEAWKELQRTALRERGIPFAAHKFLYEFVYAGRDAGREGPGPAWFPSAQGISRSNVGQWMKEMGIRDYVRFHRWSKENREEFWTQLVRRTSIRFRKPPVRILDPASGATRPRWLPGAELNIADSCFQAPPDKPAILYGREGEQGLRIVTYEELDHLSNRVAHGLERLGLGPADRVALYMPMTPESVAIYIGAIKSGRAVVGLADASAPPDVEKRLAISGAKAIFTIDSYVRDGKRLNVYEKARQANAPTAVVLPSEDSPSPPAQLRDGDRAWNDFLGDRIDYEPVPRLPGDETNVLFSSGTTKDPKAIVWTQTTPIKCVADAYLHHDVQPEDVLAWPTSFGWMMGPWLTYASLVNKATMALYNGSPTGPAFARFVQDTGVTLLGVVPKLVRAWKAGGVLEGVDWTGIRRFSSTGETSTPEEMLWLMQSAGYRPVIEYCGGTEIGGGYVTGTVVQPAAPACFTTPALGLDFFLLGEDGRPARRGEVGLIPPSIGLSNDLLNYDHHKEYFEGFPPGPHGEVLRRHGDQLERLGGGFYRHHGRMDDMINLNGVKTSCEELRAVIGGHPLVYDTKPIAVDTEGSGQRVLVVYAIPREAERMGDESLRGTLRADFQKAIKDRLNPLLAHVHDVVLVAELPQAGPGKTRTMKDFRRDYETRRVQSSAPGA